MRSQGGCGAGVALSTNPTCVLTREPLFFRILLLRRLRLPLSLTQRDCRCGAGVLGRRGFAVESAVARVSVLNGIARACSSVALYVVVHFQPRQFMGRNRKFVLEDTVPKAVWRTILRVHVHHPRHGGRTSLHRFLPRRSLTQSKDAGPPVQSPMAKPYLNPDEELKVAQARVVKFEAAIMAIGDEDPQLQV